jgi:hypothetical protein
MDITSRQAVRGAATRGTHSTANIGRTANVSLDGLTSGLKLNTVRKTLKFAN